MSIKAIETQYKGYRFRSRLEARWAVFFDTLEIKWEYEKEGFDLGEQGYYLPDFWLPEYQYWIEIKGQSPTEAECEKAHLLAKMTKKKVFIFYGDIPDPTNVDSKNNESAHMFDGCGGDIYYYWCQCPHCGSLGVQFDGRADRLGCHHSKGCPTSAHGDKGYNYDSLALVYAYETARSARFEHGENGYRPESVAQVYAKRFDISIEQARKELASARTSQIRESTDQKATKPSSIDHQDWDNLVEAIERYIQRQLEHKKKYPHGMQPMISALEGVIHAVTLAVDAIIDKDALRDVPDDKVWLIGVAYAWLESIRPWRDKHFWPELNQHVERLKKLRQELGRGESPE